ncbi:hypothetical protein GGC63_006019 [Paenibacillus sp. OAS669]|nr:hypothetical protein [Paenibacillus sp. OAS669]
MYTKRIGSPASYRIRAEHSMLLLMNEHLAESCLSETNLQALLSGTKPIVAGSGQRFQLPQGFLGRWVYAA